MALYLPLVNRLASLRRRHATLLVGIDGCGGAGKTHLARSCQQAMPDTTIVHGDDFYLPTAQRPARPTESFGVDYDWQRLDRDVLRPLVLDRPARYQRYDWTSDRLAEWHEVPIGGVVIVEGVYSTRSELKATYDFTVWVNCPRSERLRRGLARDGEGKRAWWEEWMAEEDRYVAVARPQEKCDLVVAGYVLLDESRANG